MIDFIKEYLQAGQQGEGRPHSRAEPSPIEDFVLNAPKMITERKRSLDKDSILDRSFRFDHEEQGGAESPRHLDWHHSILPDSPLRFPEEGLQLSRNHSEARPRMWNESYQLPVKCEELWRDRFPEPNLLSILPKRPPLSSPARRPHQDETEQSDLEAALNPE